MLYDYILQSLSDVAAILGLIVATLAYVKSLRDDDVFKKSFPRRQEAIIKKNHF